MLLILLLLLLMAMPLQAAPIGTWSHHYAYTDLTHVVPTPQYVYALSNGRLFAYRPADNTVEALNTLTGMGSSEEMRHVAYNSATRTLCVAYAGGIVDMVTAGNPSDVTTFRHIADQTTTLQKNIVAMTSHGDYVFVVLPERLVQFNTRRREITDTYTFSSTGADFSGALVTADSVYIASNKPLTAYAQATMLAVNRKDNMADRTLWQPVDAARETAVRSLIAAQSATYGVTTQKHVADTHRHCQWGADAAGLLMQYTDEGTALWGSGVRPDGPWSNNVYTLYWKYNSLYACGEGWTRDNDPNMTAAMQQLTPSGHWMLFQNPTSEEIGLRFVDASCIDVDPRDTSHVMVGAKSGIYEFKDHRFIKRWSKSNSLVKSLFDGDIDNYQMILGLAYDSKGRLYAGNSLSSNALLRFDQSVYGQGVYGQGAYGEGGESEWHHIADEFLDNTKYIHYPAGHRFDKAGRLWFFERQDGDCSVYCMDPKTETLTRHRYSQNQNAATVQTGARLRDIAFDKEGNVWVGGDMGVAYLPYKQFGAETTEMRQPVVSRNDGSGQGDYLLSSVSVSSIIFDSADRMYVGTENSGVIIISADRQSQLANYTTRNSHIMSDNVRGLALDENTGTLYIATDRGLCSLVTDGVTTPASLSKDNITVYPNPVPPTYGGMITIKGLTVGADLKITTATGYVVHEGLTDGPVYQWDGRDGSGERCASGVYNIMLSTPDGEEGTVAKVALIK